MKVLVLVFAALLIPLYLDPQYAIEAVGSHDADLRDVAACSADPARPNAVYVVSNADRHVHQVWWNGTAWEFNQLAQLGSNRPGAMSCGEAWPANGETPELYVAQGTVLRMVAWNGSAWTMQTVTTVATSLDQNKPAAGDLDPTLPGPELYFAHNALKQAWWNGSGWQVAALPGTPKYTAIGDADPEVPGVELYTSQNGATRQVRWARGWQTVQIAAVGGSKEQNDIEVGDADGDGQADVVLNWHATNSAGRLWFIRKSGGSWVVELVFQAGVGTTWTVHHFHGVEVGEFDASHSGPEILLTWSPQTHNPGRFSSFGKVGTAWTHRLLWEDLDEMHGAALADVDPRHPGLEAVLVGHPLEVLLVREGP